MLQPDPNQHPDIGNPTGELPEAFPKEEPAPGVQEASPQLRNSEAPQKIEENDLLRYQLLGQKLQKAELLIQMYQRELQHAQAERGALVQDARSQAAVLKQKYGISLETHLITEDGYIILKPRQ